LIQTLLRFIREITPVSLKRRIKDYLVNQYKPVQIRKVNVIHDDNVLHIAILLHGGFGDVLISNAWIKEFYRHFDCVVEIDIFTSHKNTLFLGMPYKIRLFKKYLYGNAAGYDLKLEILHFVKINQWIPSRIINMDKKIYGQLEKINSFYSKYAKYVKAQPLSDGEWANLMIKMSRNRWSQLDIDGVFDFDSTKGILHPDNKKYVVLDKLGLQDKIYITMHIGSGNTSDKNARHVKLWPLIHYIELCKLIKQFYPDLLIVQLGTKNSLPIQNVDLNILGQLDMPENIIVLKHSLLHIDGESGLVHIKRQLHGKSIVLFGPTPIEYFKYDENININSPYHCTNCMWMLTDWHVNCVNNGLGYPAKCMEAITPQMVIEEFIKYIDTVLTKKTEISFTSLEIYSTAGLNKYDSILTDICSVFNIEKLPVSEHIYYDDARFYIHSSKQWEYPFVVDKITAYSKQERNKSLKIADVGGGGSLLAPYLARLDYDTTVYDLNYTWDHNGDPEHTEKLRLRYAESIGLKMEYGSIFNIPAEDNTFDVVTCVSVVEYVPEKIYAFKEMLRVLKPGGILIVTMEIFTLDLIHETLTALGIKETSSQTSMDIQKALNDIQSVKENSPGEIAVIGFVLNKEMYTESTTPP
jgi:ADP-heptose:LPS heptosyltransferase/2-polyprenyl-3-methyl-5-hydroxy-6-metoxy-1,4-benzoquinol methylase